MSQGRLFAAPRASDSADDIARAIARFAQFPYQRPPYSRRNWGHPLHSLCSYPSKLKPGLAHFLVRTFTRPGETVLDPFAGVGTVPFEACLQGRVGIGSDLSPFASLITAAKLAPAHPAVVADTLKEIDERIAAERSSVDLDPVDPEIRSFFHDDTCREILVARRYLFDPARIATAAGRLVASALCHILHGNRPYALSRRSHGIIPIPPKGAFVHKPLVAPLAAKLARLRTDELPDDFVPGRGFCDDASDLPLADDSVDAVLTSPPFLGTTEFLRQNRVRLWFCGMDLQRQSTTKDRFLEYKRDLAIYRDLLMEWARVLRPGGRLVMHLGVVRRRDMATEIRPHAGEAGFVVHDVLYEPAGHLENHGRTDRGATHTHQFLIAELAES